MIRKLSLLLFLIGFIVVSYNIWSYLQATQSVQDIPEKTKKTEAAALDITEKNIPEKKEVTVSSLTLDYDIEEGSEVATLDIPAMDKRFTTYWGADESTLDQGVGMYVSKWTTVPNRKGGHTVLSGHRDTVFTGLDELKQGNTLEVHYDGETFEYEINKTWITDADDRTVIVEKDKPTLTLTTCYPFNYIGFAPDRYIVEATLIE